MAFETLSVLCACVAQFALLVLALTAHKRSALATPLAALCLVSLGWTFADWAYGMSGDYRWHVLDVTFSPLVPAAAFWFITSFVGKQREHRAFYILVLLACLTLSCVSFLSGIFSWARDFQDSLYWELSYLMLMLPVVSYGSILLWRHHRSQVVVDERLRTKIILAGLILSFVFGMGELLSGLLVAVPETGSLGSLTAALALSTAVLRWKLFHGRRSWLLGIYLTAVVLALVVLYLFVLETFESDVVWLGFIALLSTVILLLLIMRLVFGQVRSLMQQRRLAFAGTIAEQVIHDLANPLASIKGAAQFLLEEQRRGRSLDKSVNFVELIEKEATRLGELSENYRRLLGFRLELQDCELQQFVNEIAATAKFAMPSSIQFKLSCSGVLGRCLLDPNLVKVALENVVNNAVQAMTQPGLIELLVEQKPSALTYVVRDQGRGMDARELQQARTHFFTTKAQGSGLGLWFVDRVMQVHHGQLQLESALGQGTTVKLIFPCKTQESQT